MTAWEVPSQSWTPCARHGLRRTCLVMLYRYLYLAFLPRPCRPALAVPSTVQFLRPISFNQSGDEGYPHGSRSCRSPTSMPV